jgi:alkanesulfonate monooxygenase
MKATNQRLPAVPIPPRLQFNWCVPVAGDGFYLGLPKWEREPSLAYAVSIAETAAQFGFSNLLVGMGFDHHDLEAWTLATAMLALTQSTAPSVSAMIAVRPGFYAAPVLAKMAATLDGITQGRLSLNVVTGGRPDEQAMYGDQIDHDARYRRTGEFLQICKRLWSSLTPFDFAGEFHTLKQSRLDALPFLKGGPHIYFGGASVMATKVGAEHADTYLMWGEPLSEIETRLAALRTLVEAHTNVREQALRYGLRINIIARETDEEAKEAARAMLSKVRPAVLEKGRRTEFPNTRRESVGQGRQWEFRGRADAQWYVEPGLWAGISVVRSGAGMALVGSYDEVAGRLLQYADLGITSFILSGYPHLEECANVGRNVLPRVRERALLGKRQETK